MPQTCPYCRSPFAPDEDPPVACPACGTQHHADCLAENGGCTVFGCSQAPADEAKVSISTQDISRPQPIAPPPPAATPRVPPPPPPSGSIAPPPRLNVSPNEFAPAYTNQPAEPTLMTFGGMVPRPASTGYVVRKNRVAYVMLAIFFGSFGVHNFYAGYIKRAVIQLCLSVFTVFIASPIIWIWAVIEACRVSEDSDGTAFN